MTNPPESTWINSWLDNVPQQDSFVSQEHYINKTLSNKLANYLLQLQHGVFLHIFFLLLYTEIHRILCLFICVICFFPILNTSVGSPKWIKMFHTTSKATLKSRTPVTHSTCCTFYPPPLSVSFSWSLWNPRRHCERTSDWRELWIPWYSRVSVSARLSANRLICSNLSPRQPVVWTAPCLYM